ncbi:GNAT family N-acetyltransferase [Peribacillus frigoritolerans]|uniref:GNAT family N-acetyltransferase n=1 Tax=Peribacillus frigoritolerans TaxID=450367 RepID=UPI002E1DC8B1|nr:GNAT family N-acetyltransferase [Peribacillus frigoritolerans]
MRIRKAVLTDAKGIAKVHVDSWKTTYANIIPDEYLNNLAYEGREQLWKGNIPNSDVFVAENEEGKIVGFSSGGKERSGKYPDYTGELYAIYILKEYQGNGLGKLLVKPIIEELQQKKIFSMTVLVLEDNSSRLFYETLGGKKIDTIEVNISGKKLNELVYGWDNIRTLL